MHDVSGTSTTLVNIAPPAQAGFDTLINVAPSGQPQAVLAAWWTPLHANEAEANLRAAELDAKMPKPDAQTQADFAAEVPVIEVSAPDALLTNLAPNSTPLKGQVPLKSVDVQAAAAEAERRAKAAEALQAQPLRVNDSDIHPPVDAIKTNLPAGRQ